MAQSSRKRPPLRALYAEPKVGSEQFHSSGTALGFDLASFWRWSASDLVDNTARGVLAEYLVARALDADLSSPRRSWTPYDLVTPGGLTVEVKTSAYLQAWGQSEPAVPSFDVARRQAWNHELGRSEGPTKRHADVHVFALLAHRHKPTLDPVDVTQWLFLVMATSELETRFGKQKRVGIGPLTGTATWVSWSDLASEFERVAVGGSWAGKKVAPARRPSAKSRPLRFGRYIGVDYSGARTADDGLTGLRVFVAERDRHPQEVRPPEAPRRHWSRRGITQWLMEKMSEDQATLVGIDHGFSFPFDYFEKYRLLEDWPAFLDDFQAHWPTDEPGVSVDLVRKGARGKGANRTGSPRWRRLTEVRAGGAKSVFHFDVPGQVAKSTHAGLPWLRFLRNRLGSRVHFWPFDGWSVPSGKSVIVEVYPRLWNDRFDRQGRSQDQHDAWSIAEALRRTDRDGGLDDLLSPKLTEAERGKAAVEGWILGVG